MNKNRYAIWAVLLTMFVGLTSCSDENSEGANSLAVSAFYPTIVMDGTEVEITGNGLDLTTDVIFPGGLSATSVRVIDNNRIVATAPDGVSETPDVLVVMTENGEVHSRQTIHKAVPALRYFNPADNVKTFEDLQIEGNDFLLVKSVIFGEGENEVEIEALDFKRKSNSNITVMVPEDAPLGENIPVRVRFENGEELELGSLNIEEGEIPGGHWEEKTTVLYDGGDVVMGGWEGYINNISADVFADAQIGDVIRVYIKDQTEGWQQGSFKNGSTWGGLTEELGVIGLSDEDFERGYYEMTIDEVTLPQLQESGLIISGCNYTATKVEMLSTVWVVDIKINETILYDGDPVVMTMDVWGYPENITVGAEAFAKAKVGDIIREYVKDPTGGFDTNNWDNRMVGVLRGASSTWVERYYNLWEDENNFINGYCDYVLDEEFLTLIQSEGLELIGCRHTCTKLSLIVP